MAFSKIMVPYDGSKPSKKALKVAMDISAHYEGSTVYAVSVISPGSIEMGAGTYESYEKSLRELLEETRVSIVTELNEFLGEDTDVVIDTTPGRSPIQSIVTYADDNDIDLIVMGNRGLGAIRTLLGSVSTGVLHEAKCPVMTVKE